MASTVNLSDIKDTISLMMSPDYKERFIAEYAQTKIRYNRLHRMIVRAEAGTLDFTLTCPIALLKDQARAMGEYLFILEQRAELEGIALHMDAGV